ncbi:hypothetical protein DA2_2838 [Desulfovibrio sp. A2]|nr:hypothetical protein DA2_2838 [Desulfovibrio sp. A2]
MFECTLQSGSGQGNNDIYNHGNTRDMTLELSPVFFAFS